MPRWAARGPGLGLVLALCGAQAAPPDIAPAPVAGIERMLAAGEGLDYVGDVVYASATQLVSLHLVHAAGPDGGRERLYSRDGRYWEMRRTGSRVNLLVPPGVPARGVILPTGGNFARVLPARLKRLSAVYTMERVGVDRVAGRAADVWAVRPRDAHRYGLLLASDQATGLLLRAAQRSEDGLTSEQMFFPAVTIQTAEAPASVVEPELVAAPGLVEQPLGPTLTKGGWQAGWLPWGFAARSHLRGVRSGSGRPFEQILYSDGLSTVSVFVEPLTPDDPPLVGLGGESGISVYAGVVQAHQVTVTGAAPRLTVRMIGESMRRVAEPASVGQ